LRNSIIITQQNRIQQNQRLSQSELYFFNFGPKKTTEPEPVVKEEEKSKPSQNNDQDPVEAIFKFFFGEPEAEPLGLKRFGKERFPEQYPATIDEWADPVVGDTPDIAKVRPLLKNTNFEYRKLVLTYDANRDGWNPTAFHKRVDKKGPGFVVATTSNGLTIGGYNPKGWVGYGEARGSIAAFLFTSYQLPNKKSTSGWMKLRKVGGASMASTQSRTDVWCRFINYTIRS
jgi:hypothetical protein